MCHLGTGQSIIWQLCSESSALQKVVHDWHNQKHGDSQTKKRGCWRVFSECSWQTSDSSCFLKDWIRSGETLDLQT